MYPGDATWLMLRDDIEVHVKIPDWIEERGRRVDEGGYVVPQPYISTWSKISEAMASVFIDYYLDRHYATARDALDEAEKRFEEIVEAHQAQATSSDQRNGGS